MIAANPTQPPIALITGAARRIGRAIAADLAAGGWSVAIHYRDGREDAEGLAAEIRGLGGQAITLEGDLEIRRTSPNCCRAVSRTLARPPASSIMRRCSSSTTLRPCRPTA